MKSADEIRAELLDANLQAVSRATGLHANTIYRFMKGVEPEYNTLVKLDRYLGAKHAPAV